MKELEELRNLGVTNPYFLLQLRESATEEEINEAFKKMIKKYPENAKNKDNEYIAQMLRVSRAALLNREARNILDSSLQADRKAHALEPKAKTTNSTNNNQSATTEDLLKSKSKSIRKKARKEILLPEILEDYGLDNRSELSFVDLQLILKEYVKQSWNSYQTEANIKQEQKLKDIYLLLDKKAQLYCVKHTSLSSWSSDYRSLSDLLTGQVIYQETAIYLPSTEAITFWNERLPKDEHLVTMQTMYPYHSLASGNMSIENIVKGIELGNECLYQLRKTDYMKKASSKEFIK